MFACELKLMTVKIVINNAFITALFFMVRLMLLKQGECQNEKCSEEGLGRGLGRGLFKKYKIV